MKICKKVLALFLMVICIVTPVNAYKIGDVIGEAVYTDIIASINDYNITSYNINNYTAVVAEDLRNYGFDVTWVSEERALYIKRAATNNVASTYIAQKISPSQIGRKAQNVFYTDIKNYINGVEVKSYNIDGKTIVNFDDLSAFGSVKYDDTTRRIDLSINDGLNYKISAPCVLSTFAPSGLYFKINSAGGLQIRWEALNNSNKTINYYTTTYYMFNSVGDFAYDMGGKNYFTIKTVGPVKPGDILLDFTSKYKAEAYDAPVQYVMLHTIFVEYSDGTAETIYYNRVGQKETGEFIL